MADADMLCVTIPYDATGPLKGPWPKRWVDVQGDAWAVTLNPCVPDNAPATMTINIDALNSHLPMEATTPEESRFLAGLDFRPPQPH